MQQPRDWTRHAACQGTPLYLWATKPQQLTDHERTRILQLCNQCPVIYQCTRHAIDTRAIGVTQAGRYWYSEHSHPAGQQSYPIVEHIPGSP
jgi:transcription factor WhiB